MIQFPKIILNICFLELSEAFPRNSVTVNGPPVFESLKSYCISVNSEADRNLHWACMSEGTFSYIDF